jgi:hypothetical protein
LLRETNFTPASWSDALFFPPSKRRWMLSLHNVFERTGRRFWPMFSGVIVVEAQKRLYQGLPVTQRASRRVFVPVLTPQGAARRLAHRRRPGKRSGLRRLDPRDRTGATLGTSISTAIAHAASLFDGNGIEGDRLVVDVSGDGPNNKGAPVDLARDAAVARGIVVNGLPILVSPSRTFPDLDRYYAECVTGGPGAFVLPVNGIAEFATAIRRKLILEVSGLSAAPRPVSAREPVDCAKGERDDRFAPDPALGGTEG